MTKKNYNLLMEEELKKWEEKPRLLLHVCCAPCSSAVIEKMNEMCEITVLFYNPNMDTKEEFNRREDELKRLVKDANWDSEIVVVDYDHEEFLKFAKGMENLPEGGARCMKCYANRLEKTAEYAKKNNFDYFTTTLSISPHKSSEALNTIGQRAAEKYNTKYLYSDFKKKNGFKRSTELSDEYNLYRQDYCGCEFSKIEAENRKKNTQKED